MVLTAVVIACVPTLYHIFAGLHSDLTTTQIPDVIGSSSCRPRPAGVSINPPREQASRIRGRGRGRGRVNTRGRMDGQCLMDGEVRHGLSLRFRRVEI
jgi:hypothetical protein